MASKETGSKFLYFAFGSNMCTKRIHINNPSAVFKHVAVVEGYKLFFGYSDSNVSLVLQVLSLRLAEFCAIKNHSLMSSDLHKSRTCNIVSVLRCGIWCGIAK